MALRLAQPHAELILREVKTAELRSAPTRIVGERFYIYACKARAAPPVPVWSEDLRVARPPAWMVELAEQVRLIEPELLRGALLPTGVIVGSAVIEDVIPPDRADGGAGLFRWQLADVRRIKTPRKPTGRPQPVWSNPF